MDEVTKKAKQFLRKAATLLRKPGVWTTGTYGTWKESEATFPQRCCAVGAIAKVAGCKPSHVEGNVTVTYDTLEQQAAKKAGERLKRIVGISIVNWNDSQTSHKEVVAALKEASL